MRKKVKVVAFSNLRKRPPIFQTVVTALMLDRLHAPEYVWGALGLFYLLVWLFWLKVVITEEAEEVDIFKDK